MPVTPVSTTPFGRTIPIPSDVTVTFSARDLGDGVAVPVTYAVLNSSSLRVSGATATKPNVRIEIDPTPVQHTVRIERVPGTPAPSGTFFIEATAFEGGRPVLMATWNASVSAGVHAMAIGPDVAMEAAAAPTPDAARGRRVAADRRAALQRARRALSEHAGGGRAGARKGAGKSASRKPAATKATSRKPAATKATGRKGAGPRGERP